MKITIDIVYGNHHGRLAKEAIQRNIDAQKRAVEGKSLACDMAVLMNTNTILKAIQKQLPEETPVVNQLQDLRCTCGQGYDPDCDAH
jgi:hypothetical protein